MATIEKFEELQCWQSARELCKEISEFVQEHEFRKNFVLVKQIMSSSGSSMDNIAEGIERGGNKEFIYFPGIARGSLDEVKSQLYRAFDQGYIDNTNLEKTYKLCTKTGKLITGLINYLKTCDRKGFRFNQKLSVTSKKDEENLERKSNKNEKAKKTENRELRTENQPTTNREPTTTSVSVSPRYPSKLPSC